VSILLNVDNVDSRGLAVKKTHEGFVVAKINKIFKVSKKRFHKKKTITLF